MQFKDVALTNVKKAKNGDLTVSVKIKYEDWEPLGYDGLYALWYTDEPITLGIDVPVIDKPIPTNFTTGEVFPHSAAGVGEITQ